MADKINRKFLENVKFEDITPAWTLQAKGFYNAADTMLIGLRSKPSSSFVSFSESHKNKFCYKTACYLMAHSIECGLKALYCKAAGEDVAEFSHKLFELRADLLSRGLIKETEINKETLHLAEILLQWYGRYHRPHKKIILNMIREIYTPCPENPDMLENKYQINDKSYNELKAVASFLIGKLPNYEATIFPLVFDPF